MPPRSKNTGTPSSRPSRRPALTLTCSRCRARKVKCDGRTPECRICQAYGAQCHYDKLPAMSQVISMTQRIEELERLLAAENSGHSEMGDVQEMPRQTQIHRAVSSHRELASSSAVNRPSPQFESTSAVLDPANGNYNANKDATLSYTGTEELSLISETQIDFWLSNAIAAASAARSRSSRASGSGSSLFRSVSRCASRASASAITLACRARTICNSLSESLICWSWNGEASREAIP